MPIHGLTKTLSERLPVLFVYIGWARRYDGTESIRGNFTYLKKHPKDNSEAEAFHRTRNGYYNCGIGRGSLPSKQLHVVLVARDPATKQRKVVGLYPSARVELNGTWAVARTRHAVLIPVGERPDLTMWPEGTGMRRWAFRGGNQGPEHPRLQKFFLKLKRATVRGLGHKYRGKTAQPIDEELEAFEGRTRKYFITHRRREAILRLDKIRDVRRNNAGRLRCEVPGCGFDFGKCYGELGDGYVQVHHLRPLSAASGKGVKTRIKDLAVVCANCHVMIHRFGACRPLKGLLRRGGPPTSA